MTSRRPCVVAIVPVLDEADAIGGVVQGLRDNGADLVIVVDGGSTDGTETIAQAAGARVLVERRRGYGRAIATGIEALPTETDIVLFFDGDGTDRPEFVPAVLSPLFAGEADFTMGSRLRGARERGSLGAGQIAGGWLAGQLIRWRYGIRYSDMSPFRALRRETLASLGMTDQTFGWNLEMQMRVAARGLRVVEVPVGQRRRRGGASKVSGNLRQALRATYVITKTFFRLSVDLPPSR